MKLVLASSSAIRQKLLRDAGLAFDVDVADIDEARIGAAVSAPAERALVLAREKARVVSLRQRGRIVLGADQVGLLSDGAMATFLEKPADDADHARMLLAMAGRAHTFHPAAVLVRDGVVLEEILDVVTVRFRAFGADVAEALARSGEGRFSCGGYESENRGAQLIAGIDGSAHAVLGLPLLGVLAALRRVAPELEGLLA